MEHKESETVRLPLTGIRVLELSLAVMGPTAGMVLADMGSGGHQNRADTAGRLHPEDEGFRNRLFHGLQPKQKEPRPGPQEAGGARPSWIASSKPPMFSWRILHRGRSRGSASATTHVREINPRLIFLFPERFHAGPLCEEALPGRGVPDDGRVGLHGPGPVADRCGQGHRSWTSWGGSYGVIGILTALYDRDRTGKRAVRDGHPSSNRSPCSWPNIWQPPP